MAVAIITKAQLVEAEVIALREEALEQMLNDAHERLRFPDDHTEAMMGASEVYGALSNIRFMEVTGLPSPDPEPEIEFTERATAWMKRCQEEMRGSLADRRGTIEVTEDTAGDCFVLFILDGILGES
jgi:hypothetical protein